MYSRHTTKWHTECMSHTAVCITQLLSMHNMHIIKRRKDYNQFKINMSCVCVLIFEKTHSVDSKDSEIYG